MINKKAFTLAEVLITLTIIGVIAALTIPNLMQRYQEYVTVNKVKKFYSTLSNACVQAVKENGPSDEWGISDASENNTKNVYNILIKPYFKISKDCNTNNNGNCIINNNYKYKNGKDDSFNFATNKIFYTATLDDGSSIILKSCGVNDFSWCKAVIYYDTNGKKSPNKWANDLFAFFINGNIVRPYGYGTSAIVSSQCLSKNAIGDQCAAWLIYKGNMDYLHCDDLTWNGKNKCTK